jgi:hypothetical protein
MSGSGWTQQPADPDRERDRCRTYDRFHPEVAAGDSEEPAGKPCSSQTAQRSGDPVQGGSQERQQLDTHE